MDKLRPDDHFMILLEGDQTPMHVGSLLTLAAPNDMRAGAAERLRAHLVERLPVTPLVRRLHRAPLSFDSDVWVRADDVDFDQHIVIHRTDAPMTDRDLCAFVAHRVMVRLDLRRPPFLIDILDNVSGGRVAVYLRVHHSVADGVGFQTILGLLSDDPPGLESSVDTLRAATELPTRHDWLAASVREFRRLRTTEPDREARKRAALTALGDPSLQRAETPELSISGPTSATRAYTTISIPFRDLKQLSRALDATVNDVFLALVGTAMREHLVAIDDLPEIPLTTNSARSYRRPEHGPFGNRIVAIHPHLGTHLADPIERLRSIQASMAVERRRTAHDEALLDQPETPFGPSTRRKRFAERRRAGTTILPGNVTVSNVPGPAHERTLAGFRQLSNHPTPLLGSGRAVNFTARRNGKAFDIGLMADAEKLPDVERLAARFRDAIAEYASLSTRLAVHT